MTAVHRLPPAAFVALRSEEPEAARLAESRLSQHLLQIRLVLDEVRRRARADGELAGIEESYAALAELQSVSPEHVAAWIRDPQAAAWSVWCLRRLLGRQDDGTPLPIDLAYLGAAALSVALRAGTDVAVRAPVREGWLHLPALGRLRVAPPGVSAVVPARVTGGRLSWRLAGEDLSVPAAELEKPSPRWQPLRRLAAGAAGHGWTLTLDDISPYRRLYGRPPLDRLDEHGARSWQELAGRAWELLAEHHAGWATAVQEMVTGLVPLTPVGTGDGISATAHGVVSVIGLTPQSDARRFAVTLVHEVQHSHMNTLHDVAPLYPRADGRRYYSPWRDDPRPLDGILHGCVAFLGVADFWRVERRVAGRLGAFEFAMTTRQVSLSRETLQTAGQLTRPGRQLLASVDEVLGRWAEERIDPMVQRLAADLTEEHHVAWRLRNVETDPALVAELVELWHRACQPSIRIPRAAVEQPVFADNPAPELPAVASPRRRFTGRWLAAGGADEPPGVATTPADCLHLALHIGDYPLASRWCVRLLAGNPSDLHAWSSLAISVGRLVSRPTLLSHVPEVAVALSRRLAGECDVEQLASWLMRLPVAVGEG
jgi:HEXXH motif-containing protein